MKIRNMMSRKEEEEEERELMLFLYVMEWGV